MNRLRCRIWALVACAGALLALTGCASVTQGTTQSVKIEALTAAGQSVEGAECKVSNDKADVIMLSGQSASVRRSGATLNIECTQPGLAPASGQATSRINTGMAGNILIGGVIGAAIDSSTGAGFNYPSWMQLVFGEVRTFDRSSQLGDQAMAGVRVGDTRLAAMGSALQPAPSAPAAAPSEPAAPIAPTVAAAVVPTPMPLHLSPPPSSPPSSPTALSTPLQPVALATRALASAPAAPVARVSMDDLKALLPAKP